MLQSLTLTNFKSFAGDPQTIPFATVTIFVGANGSGKSNALDALRFLQGVASDLTIADALNGQSNGATAFGIRGGFAESRWDSASAFQIALRFHGQDREEFHGALDLESGEVIQSTDPISNDAFDLGYEIEVFSPDDFSESLTEFVNKSSHPIWSARTTGSDRVAYRIENGREMSLKGEFGETTLQIAHDHPHFQSHWPKAASFLYQMEHRTAFLDLRPDVMRQWSPRTSKRLGSNGQHLSAVLRSFDELTRLRIAEWVSAMSAPPIESIGFVEPRKTQEILFVLQESGRELTAKSVSDGTLRFLGLLAAILSLPEKSVVILEEIENGLHPTRIHLLVELLEQFAAERNIQIIATTHSPQVLFGLSESALENALLFARDDEHSGTIVRRLGDLEHFDEVTKKTRIDELFSTGWLEFAV